MEREMTGKVISVSKQWWLKINTKAIRIGPADGAIFPYIIKVSYTVDGKAYTRRKWIGAGLPVPAEGSSVRILYEEGSPEKSRILC